MKKLFLLLVTVLTVSLCASAQTRTVSGTVVDESSEPLVGASVTPAGETKGVVTNEDGEFTIVVPSSVKALDVSFIGYTTQRVAITGSRLNVVMKSAIETKDEVIVVAYGTAKRSAYTGSAGVVKADQLENTQTSNVVNALSGKVAGVQLQSSYGAPGAVSTVRIRGVGTINASASPLYVVDGMPLNSASEMSSIAPSDIAEMTVLKDAASTALYGARGANGVILITTKKGAEGNAKVTVDVKWGSNSRALQEYDLIKDPRQYLETIYRAHYNTAYYNLNATAGNPAASHLYANQQLFPSIGYQTWTAPEGQNFIGENGKFNPYATPGYVYGDYLLVADDWMKNTIINGLRQEYNLSISGGTNKLKYFVSGSYLGDEGIIKASHFNRFTTRANVDYQAKSWLKIGTNISYTYQNTGEPGDQDLDYSTSVGNAFYIAQHLGPVYPMFVRDTQGNLRYDASTGNVIYDYGDAKDYGWGRLPSRNTNSSANPAGDLVYDRQDLLSDIFNGNWYAQINPLEGLYVQGTAGLYIDNSRLHYIKNPLYGSGASYKGQAIQEHIRTRTLNLQGMVTYNKQFGDHGLDLAFIFENTSMNYEVVEAVGSNLYQPHSPYVNNTIDQRRGYGYAANLVHRGFLGRVNYNYASKYYASVSVRRDGSSRFHPDNRWGTFWSASAGWDISKEDFLRENENVDMLKFKFSFGQTGNDGIGSRYLAWDDQYTISGSDGIWSDGNLAYKGNKDITWETSNSMNTGFDFSFWRGKLNGSVEYYQRDTHDMLMNVPTAPSLGYSSIPMNSGSMRNNGLEFDLHYMAFQNKNISVELNANLTLGWNKVTKLEPSILNTNENWRPDSQRGWLSGSRIFFEGQSAYQLWYVEYAGVNKDANLKRPDGTPIKLGVPLYWALKDKLDAKGDRIAYTYQMDDNGHYVLDDNGERIPASYEKEEYLTDQFSQAQSTNRKATGNLMPKGYGGFGVDVTAYGVDFSCSFAYQFGGRIIDSSYQGYMYGGYASTIGQSLHKDMLNAWSEQNPDSDVPMLNTLQTEGVYNSTSTRFLISSNYVSLNNITLGYTLPAKWTTRIGINDLRFYFSAENVALWSKRKGLDPRQGFTSSNNSTYSPIRAISGGLRLNF